MQFPVSVAFFVTISNLKCNVQSEPQVPVQERRHSAGIGKAPYTKHFRWPRACRDDIQHWIYQQVGLLYFHCDITVTQQVCLFYIHCDFTLTYILLPTVAKRIFGNSLIPCFQFGWWWVVVLRPQWCRVQHPRHIFKNQDISPQGVWLLQGPLT